MGVVVFPVLSPRAGRELAGPRGTSETFPAGVATAQLKLMNVGNDETTDPYLDSTSLELICNKRFINLKAPEPRIITLSKILLVMNQFVVRTVVLECLKKIPFQRWKDK